MVRSIVLGVMFAMASLGSRVAIADDDALAAALRAQAKPIAWTVDGGVSGEGGDWLRERAAAAQFLLIGEEHGLADVPELAQALQQSLGAQRYPHLVVEVGPWSADRAEQALRADADGLAALNRQFPFAMPFLNLREDAALAASFVRDGGADDALWGVDQEFLLGPAMLLDRLQALADSDVQREAVAARRARVDAAWTRMIAEGPDHAPLFALAADGDLAALQRRFPDGSEAAGIVAAMIESARIYRDQQDAPYRSNRDRSVLMKREFVRQYRAAEARGRLPRAMFKFGAFHATRGLSPTRVFDIGNLASELAQANGQRSLHVLVLAAGGEVNRALPFSTRDDRRVPYDAAAELKVLDAGALLAAAPGEGAVLLDLASLRDYGQPRAQAGSPFNALLYGYDAIVLIAKGRAATSY